MKITQIFISGLFGVFNHRINLNNNEKITIIHGPNGFGKTAIFRILNAFFNSHYSKLSRIIFDSLYIYFQNGSQLEIYNKRGKEKSFNNCIEVIFHDFSEHEIHKESFTITNINSSNKADLLEGIQIRRSKIKNKDEPSESKVEKAPSWLLDLKQKIQIHFIKSQRLLDSIKGDFGERKIQQQTIQVCSDKLAKRMAEKFRDYGSFSQSLDRTFPSRIINLGTQVSSINQSQLSDDLEKLKHTRQSLTEIGLLDQEEKEDEHIDLQNVDEMTMKALAMYTDDESQKLNVFSEISKKMRLFKDILDRKFSYSYKRIEFSKDQGLIFKVQPDKNNPASEKTLVPTALSSGEQHEVILLYQLLFDVKPQSLVLIDEPELSLHVGWQNQFLADLQNIAQLADIDILMATHSPDIIADRWDLTVELKGRE